MKPNKKSFLLTPSAANLQRLNIIRVIVVAAISCTLLYVYNQNLFSLYELRYHGWISASYCIITLLTFFRLRYSWPVTDHEYFFQLLIDIFFISLLLYFSGGASNPFTSYYLVPLCISAAILPWRYTWIIAGSSLSVYSFMLFYSQPLSPLHPAHHAAQTNVSSHILGMWFNFGLSAALITYFVVKMAASLRHSEVLRVRDREDTLRNEQLLAVATLAAGTAHELGTPLATMTILLDEIKADHHDNKPLLADIQLLQQQVVSCRSILKNLVKTAESNSIQQRQQQLVSEYIKQVLSYWQVLRPNVKTQLQQYHSTSIPTIAVDTTLDQAIINLLNNAADASPLTIDISLKWDEHYWYLTIRDQGPGIAIEIAEQLGKPFISTKGKGLGLGLFLTHATIERYHGTIELYNHAKQGTVAELKLPFEP